MSEISLHPEHMRPEYYAKSSDEVIASMKKALQTGEYSPHKEDEHYQYMQKHMEKNFGSLVSQDEIDKVSELYASWRAYDGYLTLRSLLGKEELDNLLPNKTLESLRHSAQWKTEWDKGNFEVMYQHREAGLVSEEEIDEVLAAWADYRCLHKNLLAKERLLRKSIE